jgi:hypothetical protein
MANRVNREVRAFLLERKPPASAKPISAPVQAAPP